MSVLIYAIKNQYQELNLNQAVGFLSNVAMKPMWNQAFKANTENNY